MSVINILHLLLLLGLGAIGAILAERLRMPASVFLGPIIVVGTYQIIFGSIMQKPTWLKLAVQIAVGIVLGTRISKSFLLNFKKLIKPSLLVSLTLFAFAIILGMVLKAFTGWDLLTCILSAAPAGQADMAILSDSVGAQTEKVIVLQLIRNQLALAVMLPLGRLYLKKKEGAKP